MSKNSNAEIINKWRKVINNNDHHFKNYAEEKHYYEQEASEEEFLKWYTQQDEKNYPKPSVTADFVAFRFNKTNNNLQILLVKRKANPFRNKWALPGGFLQKDESIEQALIREVKEETNLVINENQTQLLPAISTPNRDPRRWVITNPSLVMLSPDDAQNATPGDDAKETKWFNVKLDRNEQVIINANLAFDHIDIIKSAMQSLKRTLNLKIIDWLKILLGTNNTITLNQIKHCLSAIDPRFQSITASNIGKWLDKYIQRTDKWDKPSQKQGRRWRLFIFK